MIKKAIYLLAGILVAYIALTATHKGEFWPFSIYPVFSQGAHPWDYAVVRGVNLNSKGPVWTKKTVKQLRGDLIGLNHLGLTQTKLSVFLDQKWPPNETKIQLLRKYFKNKLSDKNILIYKVHGQRTGKKSSFAMTNCTPLILLKQDTTLLNTNYYHSSAD
jgi:hypothetical protein